MQIYMGVIDIYNSSSLCILKSNTTLVPNVPRFSYEESRRRVVAMSSTVPLQQNVNGGQPTLSGDSFIRPHLRKLSPYQPILPFEVIMKIPLFSFLMFLLVLLILVMHVSVSLFVAGISDVLGSVENALC